MKPKFIIAALLAAFVAAITIFLRIPIPKSGGYLNLGDVVIMFAGLYMGPKYGLVIGGVGSAVADAIGFPIFIIPTLIIKGLEGLCSGLFHTKFRILGCILGGLVMVGGYYVTEAYLFSGKVGQAAALAELPFNLLQGGLGVVGGYTIYSLVTRWSREEVEDVRQDASVR
jgi:uncharacterized membrane protein